MKDKGKAARMFGEKHALVGMLHLHLSNMVNALERMEFLPVELEYTLKLLYN